MKLPRCPHSDLPRILCACCDGFTLTDTERAHLAPVTRWGEPPALRPAPRDPRPAQPIPEYASTLATEPAPPRAGGGGTGTPCQVCQTPAGDAWLCPGCVDQAERDLGDVPALLTELHIHATGQSRFTGGADGSGLPYAERAAQLLHDARNLLSTAIRAMTEHRGQPAPDLEADTAAMSRWLLTRTASLPLDPAGPDIVADLRRWHTDALHAIDAPRPRRYIGLCMADTNGQPCRTAMHAPEGDPEFSCPRCGQVYDVAACLEHLATKVRDVTATVEELVVLANLPHVRQGRQVTRKAIEGYVRRGRISKVGKAKPARYRVDDLLHVLNG